MGLPNKNSIECRVDDGVERNSGLRNLTSVMVGGSVLAITQEAVAQDTLNIIDVVPVNQGGDVIGAGGEEFYIPRINGLYQFGITGYKDANGVHCAMMINTDPDNNPQTNNLEYITYCPGETTPLGQTNGKNKLDELIADEGLYSLQLLDYGSTNFSPGAVSIDNENQLNFIALTPNITAYNGNGRNFVLTATAGSNDGLFAISTRDLGISGVDETPNIHLLEVTGVNPDDLINCVGTFSENDLYFSATRFSTGQQLLLKFEYHPDNHIFVHRTTYVFGDEFNTHGYGGISKLIFNGDRIFAVMSDVSVMSGFENRSNFVSFRLPTDNGPDSDGDGVPDATDNCPTVANADQADMDVDGVGDACEATPADRDGDGVPDATDNCPDTFNTEQEDTNNDGVGDACSDPCSLNGTPNGGSCQIGNCTGTWECGVRGDGITIDYSLCVDLGGNACPDNTCDTPHKVFSVHTPSFIFMGGDDCEIECDMGPNRQGTIKETCGVVDPINCEQDCTRTCETTDVCQTIDQDAGMDTGTDTGTPDTGDDAGVEPDVPDTGITPPAAPSTPKEDCSVVQLKHDLDTEDNIGAGSIVMLTAIAVGAVLAARRRTRT